MRMKMIALLLGSASLMAGTAACNRGATDPKIEAKIRQLAAKGMGKGKIARTLGIGVSVTQRVLAS